MAELIQAIGGDLGHDVGGDEVKAFGGHPSGLAHTVESDFAMDLDRASVAALSLGIKFLHHLIMLKILCRASLDRFQAGSIEKRERLGNLDLLRC